MPPPCSNCKHGSNDLERKCCKVVEEEDGNSLHCCECEQEISDYSIPSDGSIGAGLSPSSHVVSSHGSSPDRRKSQELSANAVQQFSAAELEFRLEGEFDPAVSGMYADNNSVYGSEKEYSSDEDRKDKYKELFKKAPGENSNLAGLLVSDNKGLKAFQGEQYDENGVEIIP